MLTLFHFHNIAPLDDSEHLDVLRRASSRASSSASSTGGGGGGGSGGDEDAALRTLLRCAASLREAILADAPVAAAKIDIEALRAEILDARRAGEPSDTRSNRMSWQSYEMLEWGSERVSVLGDLIASRVARLLWPNAPGAGVVDATVSIEESLWANTMSRGGWHALHQHSGGKGPATWSGVFYVDPGDPDPNNPNSGCLEFIDPRGDLRWQSAACSTQVAFVTLLWPSLDRDTGRRGANQLARSVYKQGYLTVNGVACRQIRRPWRRTC